MQRFTWEEASEYLRNYNREHGYTTKGTETHCYMVAVITEDSFDKKFTLEERSYKFSNDNKAFIDGQLGYSIFSDSLAGDDPGVRLEYYLEEEGNANGWKVDYCYLLKEE